MVYRAIGLMSGSSLDGLDIVFTELEERAGKWSFEIKAAECIPYNTDWKLKLLAATKLSAYEYNLLDAAYGKYTGEAVNNFITKYQLQHQVQLISSHGHTAFHAPAEHMTAQLGNGACIAAETGINVVSELRAMDVALGGQGAPIVPVGEIMLFPGYMFYLNLGGIANLSVHNNNTYIAFDVCPANRVLNTLAEQEGKAFDEGGNLARSGNLHTSLLEALNSQEYYSKNYPKSLSNDFGTDKLLPLIHTYHQDSSDALHTYTVHIADQLVKSIMLFPVTERSAQILVTGGGALNDFLIETLREKLAPLNINLIVPDKNLIQYKEALIMALLGVLRWREENTVMQSVTGAVRSSIGGAVWIGQEA